ERARGGGRGRLALEAARLFDPAVERGQPALVGLGREQFAVARDVGGRDPLRRAELFQVRAHLAVDPGDEGIGALVGRDRAAAGIGLRRRRAGAAGNGEQGGGDGEREQSAAGHGRYPFVWSGSWIEW